MRIRSFELLLSARIMGIVVDGLPCVCNIGISFLQAVFICPAYLWASLGDLMDQDLVLAIQGCNLTGASDRSRCFQ